MNDPARPPPAPEEAGRIALWQLDEALERKPEKEDHLLSELVRNLCLYREALIAAARRGGEAERQRLGRLNMVLTVAAAVEFPAGDVPWEALASARDTLAGLAGRPVAKA